MQLSSGQNIIKYDNFAFPELSIGYYYLKQAMYELFDVPSDSVVLIICRTKLPVVYCGMEVLPSVLHIFRPGRTYWVKLPAGWEAYEFVVSEQLNERIQLFPPQFFEKTFRFGKTFLPMVEPQTGDFIREIDYFFQRVRNRHEAIEGAIFKTEFYDFTLYRLQQLIDVSFAADYPQRISFTRRADLVDKVNEIMNANLELGITADEIAQTLGISYRVLNYAFKSNLGVSPYQFFLTKKLHAVRRLLKSSDISVIEACTSHGFSTPSRFTRQYKRLFDELPSETKNS